ncbi:MAG: hypothetical protein LBT44_03145 [Clostridiales bacterium]|nr:hypothetical protein [Clostridiales bacterium]
MMRKKWRQKNDKVWRLVFGAVGLAAAATAAALLISRWLRERDLCGLDCCCDDDEYCDENGCCYTDGKNFV